MSAPTRAWLACLAVLAALVVVVPALTVGTRPAQRAFEPIEDAETGFDPDAELVFELERALERVRTLAQRDAHASNAREGSGPATVRVAARVAEPSEPVTLEAFVAEASLRGVYYGASYRAAVLNDELVQEGDLLAPGLSVCAIGQRHVLLELGGEQARLDLIVPAFASRGPRVRGGRGVREESR